MLDSQIPSQQRRQGTDAKRELDVSLTAIEAAVATLAKVEDSDERDEMARSLQRELEDVRERLHQLHDLDHDGHGAADAFSSRPR